MRTSILSIILFLFIVTNVEAQELNTYKYVQVPEKFEFFDEPDRYQLNALTAFLLEKYGFEALYKEELPVALEPCDLLSIKVYNESNLFRVKVYFTLEDCEAKEVFKSDTGVSKRKDYKDSYQEAIRVAFESLKEVNYRYEDSSNDKKEKASEVRPKENLEKVPEVIVDPIVTAKEIEETEIKVKDEKVSDKTGSFRSFTNGTDTYELRKTAVGFDLFKANESKRFAKLLKTSGEGTYLYSSENVQGTAFFDTDNNLVVEFLNDSTGQLLRLVYRAVDQ
ncbi:hypothetical protein [Salinimicrobium soli]|uniref:hypothetical protein n=1 Tax=Salinimicrobium soli TaxID=1254399 RepID=UPI003AAAC4F6